MGAVDVEQVGGELLELLHQELHPGSEQAGGIGEGLVQRLFQFRRTGRQAALQLGRQVLGQGVVQRP